jgi:two-component system, OmpR family, sensor kinase
MSGSRRLSLRGRMLVLLVGVTTILLMVMGTVSTYLLARRVDTQISQADANLSTQADNLKLNPDELAGLMSSDPGEFLVAEVPLEPQLTAMPITTGAQTERLVAAVDSWLQGSGFAPIRAIALQGDLDQAMLLIGDRGCGRFPDLGCRQPFGITPQLSEVARVVPLIGANGRPDRGRDAILFVAQPAGDGPAEVRGFIIAELITGAALIALVALGGEWLIGRGLEPLDRMTSTANEISARGDLTARMPEADDQDEVGRLGASINTMLDRIQQAFSSRVHSEQKVREFAADASHELRTPLTTIRGYAELYRQGALGPDQLPSAMRRIEQEAQRMSTLVAELLELARLDRTSSLDLTETDLASIVRDAVADAIAVEPERPVRAEAPPRLVAVVDEPRIRQVLANLLGNVRAHTPVTTPVAVRLGAITGGVLLEVADAGPGMSAEDAIRAFDRFHRAAERSPDGWAPAQDGTPEPSHNGQGGKASLLRAGAHRAEAAGPGGGRPAREQPVAERSGGSGLGLSIVQAIANAHGGRATLESRPGKGTKVRLWLPVRTVP